MFSLNSGAFVGFGLVALLGLTFVASGPSASPEANEGTILAVATTASELAAVTGMQMSENVECEWEEKCCKETNKCTPELPLTAPPRVSFCLEKQSFTPNGHMRNGCIGGNGAWVCTGFVGAPAKNQECVVPPAGSILVPSCLSGPSVLCQQYRDGLCNMTLLGFYCVCDLNDAVKDAMGKKTCKAGSTACSDIVPVEVQ